MILFTYLTSVPLRAAASDAAEMVSQLLFGDFVVQLERERQWLKVKCLEDGYQGWIDHKMVVEVTESWKSGIKAYKWVEKPHVGAMVTGQAISFPLPLSLGCRVPVVEGSELGEGLVLDVAGLKIQIPASGLIEAGSLDISAAETMARRYLGAPYLWGGKNLWGIDCSGLTQRVYAMCGIQLARDASQQVEQGQEVPFENRRSGDLAFFVNKKGKVTHVGIVTEDGGVLHASGRVRADLLTGKGIKNLENSQRTHNLLKIKRYK